MTQVKSRQVFVLLASLATHPRPLSREKIAARLWPNTVNSLQNLRPVLTYTRQILGTDALVANGDSLQLSPHILTTDLNDLVIACEAAKSTRDPHKRVAVLREATILLNGEFLEGFEEATDSTDLWLTQQRQQAQELTTEVWSQLAEALLVIGDTRGASEARRFARDFREPEARGKQKSHDWKQVREHLATLHRDRLMLTAHEERVVHDTLQPLLATFSDSLRRSVDYLTVFPQSFTVEQATMVAGSDPNDLQYLIEQGILVGVGERFWFPAGLEKVLRRGCKRGERAKAIERHARHFAERARFYTHRENVAVDLKAWTISEANHIVQAVEWWTNQPLSESVRLLLLYFHQAALTLPAIQPLVIAPIIACYECSLNNESVHPAEKYTIDLIAYKRTMGDFAGAVHWAQKALKQGFDPLAETSQDVDFLSPLLAAAHHAGDDGVFDAATVLNEELLSRIPDSEPNFYGFRAEFYFLLAENRLARRDGEGALRANTAAMQWLNRLLENYPLRHRFVARFATNHYQRGQILHAMGDTGQALAEWDIALHGFRETGDQHGIADCLHQMGIAFGQQGLLSVGRENIERAIEIYATLGKHNSRAAALGSLGDILLQSGNREEARRLYEEGLAIWEEQQHPRWIEKFQQRLHRISD